MELGGIGSYDKVVFPYGGYGLMYMVSAFGPPWF